MFGNNLVLIKIVSSIFFSTQYFLPNSKIDENVLTTFYLDEDLDGYGSELSTIEACEVPNGYVPIGNDCDDTNEDIFPAATEICDEIDNNCNDEIDEGVGTEYYVDRDSDGFGDDSSLEWHCEAVEGVTLIGGDCDDTNAVINPDATEVCDGSTWQRRARGMRGGRDGVASCGTRKG